MMASTTSNSPASSGSWSSSKPSWRGCGPRKRPRRWMKNGWRKSPPCWRNSRKTASPSMTCWFARWWKPSGWNQRKNWKSRSRMGTGRWLNCLGESELSEGDIPTVSSYDNSVRYSKSYRGRYASPALAAASYPFVDLPSGDTLRCKLFPADKFHKICYLFDRQ